MNLYSVINNYFSDFSEHCIPLQTAMGRKKF